MTRLYCTHQECRLRAASVLWWIGEILPDRPELFSIARGLTVATGMRVPCALDSARLGALEYDSWNKDGAI